MEKTITLSIKEWETIIYALETAQGFNNEFKPANQWEEETDLSRVKNKIENTLAECR